MKHVHFILEDDESEVILKAKGDLTWRQFILTLVVRDGGDDEK